MNYKQQSLCLPKDSVPIYRFILDTCLAFNDKKKVEIHPLTSGPVHSLSQKKKLLTSGQIV